MKKTVKIMALLVCAATLALCLAGCVKLTDELSEEEKETAARSLEEIMEFSGEDIEFSVLYNKHDKPVYLLAASEKGYAIFKRGSGTMLEAGESNPYSRYMELKKYYGPVLNYTVYDSTNPEGAYHFLRTDTYGATLEEAVKGK